MIRFSVVPVIIIFIKPKLMAQVYNHGIKINDKLILKILNVNEFGIYFKDKH